MSIGNSKLRFYLLSLPLLFAQGIVAKYEAHPELVEVLEIPPGMALSPLTHYLQWRY